MAFWRRSRGRHALGAPLRSVPPTPVQAVEAAPVPTIVPPAVPTQAPPLDWAFPELHAPGPPPAAAPTGPRVELTFRDGTSASLDGTQARALDEIAQVLTRRDGVKH
jgi:hypothetical protein